jgi:multiple sugar transport system ATP-binding protein
MRSVELLNVTKRFGEATIVEDLSLSVDAGAFLVLVGPSGCGKTTTLRMLAGLEDASGGEIRLGGRRVNELPPKDRDVAMVFQSYALYPHMSVYENMAFGLSLRKVEKPEIKRRVEEAARVLEIGHLLQRRPKDLSGGQRQRVAIGRAIVRKPAVFLFDEPLSNLDAALRVQMRAELQALHRRLGATMVYVTHDQVEAMMLATRIAVLEGGKLRQIGPPLELYHRPADRFVAGFIGSPSMNFVEGQVEGGAFEAPGLRVVLPAPVEPQKKVTLGVRPHDIGLAPAGLSAEATVVEPMGWEAFVHVKCGAGWLVMRLEGEAAAQVKTGDKLTIAIPGDKVHLFDEQGRALLHPAAESTASPKVA